MTEAADFFVAGGTLRPDAPSYVTRPADHDLLQQLQAGEFCYVLTPRQMGKSSLMVRTAQRLRQDGTRVAIVDLTSIGTGSSELSPDQWYLGLLSRIRSQLRLATDVQAWWDDHQALGIAQRFITFLHDVLLAECSEPVVIMIDEIDSTLSFDFRDDFFIAIRSIYNARATDPICLRLTFALFGVATPTDLIQDRERTPFNIGKRINLYEFTWDDAKPLLDGLTALFLEQANSMLQRIFYWTNGHPYLTQKFCQVLQTQRLTNEDTNFVNYVDDVLQTVFISEEGRKDPNLTFVQDRIASSHNHEKRRMLKLYQQVLRSEYVPNDDRSLVQNRLELYGLVGVAQGQLHVRNRIYMRVFGSAWIASMMPVNQRQYSALLTALGALILTVAIGWYIYSQPTVDCAFYEKRFNGFQDSEIRLNALANLLTRECKEAARESISSLSMYKLQLLFLAVQSPKSVKSELKIVINEIYNKFYWIPLEENLDTLEAMFYALQKAVTDKNDLLLEEIDSWVRGKRFYLEKNYISSLEEYNNAISINGENPLIYYDRAKALIALNRYPDAIEDWEKTINLASNSQYITTTVLGSLDLGGDRQTYLVELLQMTDSIISPNAPPQQEVITPTYLVMKDLPKLKVDKLPVMDELANNIGQILMNNLELFVYWQSHAQSYSFTRNLLDESGVGSKLRLIFINDYLQNSASLIVLPTSTPFAELSNNLHVSYTGTTTTSILSQVRVLLNRNYGRLGQIYEDLGQQEAAIQ